MSRLATLFLLLPLLAGCRGYEVVSETTPNAALVSATTFHVRPLNVSFDPSVWNDVPSEEDWQENVDFWREEYMSELVDTPSGLEILQLPPDGSVTEGILIDGDLFEIEPIFPDYYAAIALTFTNIATGEVLYQAQISAVSWRGWTLTAQVRSTLSRLASGTHRAMKRGTVQ